VSTTETVNVGHEAVLPALSVAEHTTSTDPTLNVLPETDVHDCEEMPELSTAENVQLAAAVGVLPFVGITTRALVVVYGGQVSVGADVSVFRMANTHVAVLLA